MNLHISLSNCMKNFVEITLGIALNLEIAFGKGPFLLYQYCQSMKMKSFSIFWDFLLLEKLNSFHTALSFAWFELRGGIFCYLRLLWRVSFPVFLSWSVYSWKVTDMFELILYTGLRWSCLSRAVVLCWKLWSHLSILSYHLQIEIYWPLPLIFVSLCPPFVV